MKPDGTPPRHKSDFSSLTPDPGHRALRKPDSSQPAADIDRKTGHFALLVPQKGHDADVGGFLHMNKCVMDGGVERLPPPAVHAQPKPPVANAQPIGRCELV